MSLPGENTRAGEPWLRHGETVRDDRLRALLAIAREGEPLTLRVDGACMAPRLPERATIVVRGAAWYWPGDIVAFFAGDGRFLVHRVLGYRLRAGGLLLMTGADAATGADDPVARRRVLGRVRAVVSPAVPGRLVSAGDRLRALRRYGALARRRLRRLVGLG